MSHTAQLPGFVHWWSQKPWGKKLTSTFASQTPEVQEIPPKGKTAEPLNPTLARIIGSPLSFCLPFPRHVSMLVAMDTLVTKQGSISPASTTQQTQLLSYQCKTRFDIKDPWKGNRGWHYGAAKNQTLLYRALCLQEPSKKPNSITPLQNPVDALIQVKTKQRGQGLQKGHHHDQPSGNFAEECRI